MKVIISFARHGLDKVFGRLIILLVLTGQIVSAQTVCPLDTCAPVVTGTWETFNTITTNEQLPDNQINALWVSPDQVLWAGTEQGLARYDGFRWRLAAVSILQGRSIRAIAGDGGGRLWIGTMDGLIVLDGQRWQRQTTEQGLSDNWINVLVPDNESGVWIGTLNGLTYFDGTTFEVVVQTETGQSLGNVKAIAPIDDQQAYAASGSSIFYVNGAETAQLLLPGLSGERVQALAFVANGRLWIGTNRGFYLYADDQIQPILSENEPMNIQTITHDPMGGIWLCTTDGLWHINGTKMEQYSTANSELTANNVKTIVQDAQGTLWIGAAGGVSRWRPTAWQTYPFVGTGIKAAAGSGDQKWVVSDSGLWVQNGQEWRQVVRDAAVGLWVNEKAVWTGVDQGVVQLDAKTGLTTARIPLPSRPRVLYGTDDDTLWIGMDEGLAAWRSDEELIIHQLPDGNDFSFVNALLVTETAVWVGTSSGLYVRSEARWHTVTWGNDLLAERVRALAQGADGSIWVGTDVGVRRLLPQLSFAEAEAWQHYAVSDGLANDQVNAIWADANGQIWVGSNGGVSGLDDNQTIEKEDDIWVGFTDENGLPSSQITSLWRDDAGNLWIGTDSFLTRYAPVAERPSVAISGIQTEGRLLPLHEGREVVLDWRQTDVDVQFNGVGLNSGQFRYRYRLSNGDWSVTDEPGTDLQLLPDTHYDIDLQVVDESLNKSPVVNRRFAVAAVPLSARAWVQIAGGLSIVGLTGGLLVVGPGGRWWRALHRVSYREVWHLQFNQTENVISVLAKQDVKRHPFLLREGQGQRLFNTTAQYHHMQSMETQSGNTHLARLMPPQLVQRISEINKWPGYHMRLRFDFTDAPDLAGCSWEEVEAAPGQKLGLNVKTAVSRTLSSPARPNDAAEKEEAVSLSPVSIRETLKVLIFVASPEMPPVYPQLPKLKVQQEVNRIKEAVEGRSVAADVIARADGKKTELPQQEELPLKLQDTENGPPHVVHYIGHAGYDPGNPTDLVLFLEDQFGQYRPLGAPRFVKMIQESQSSTTGPRLIVLNACQTAAVQGGNVLAGLVPSLLVETGVKAVVGMQYPIGDQAATIFSTTFYEYLLQTQPVDYAVSQARAAIKEQLGSDDWAAPVVYMKDDDGMIYEK